MIILPHLYETLIFLNISNFYFALLHIGYFTSYDALTRPGSYDSP